jgi:hypothetical protein
MSSTNGTASNAFKNGDAAARAGHLPPKGRYYPAGHLVKVDLDAPRVRRRLLIQEVRGLAVHGGYHHFTRRSGGREVYPRCRSEQPPRPRGDCPDPKQPGSVADGASFTLRLDLPGTSCAGGPARSCHSSTGRYESGRHPTSGNLRQTPGESLKVSSCRMVRRGPELKNASACSWPTKKGPNLWLLLTARRVTPPFPVQPQKATS